MPEQSTELTVVERAAVALNSAEHERKLVELAQASSAILAITNTDSYKECHSARMALKRTRIEIERAGKTAREDATAFSKAVIAEEKRLIGIIEPEESRLEKIQTTHDEAVAAERERKRKLEQERIDGIQSRIDAMRRKPLLLTGASAERIAAAITEIRATEITPADFGEFVDNATAAKGETLEGLTLAHGQAQAMEAEAAQIKAEREELDRQRAEHLRIEQEAQERRDREEAAAKAERDRADREAREQREREEATARAERERLDAIARQDREEADRVAKAAQDAAEAEAREAREVEERRLAAERAEIERKARELAEREATEAAAAEAKRKADVAAEAERRRAAEAEAIKELATRPESALREMVDVCADPVYSDAQARARVGALASAMLELWMHEGHVGEREAA